MRGGYAVVRICGRCGTRAEWPVTAVCEVVRLTSVLMKYLRDLGSVNGCPECVPELLEGFDRELGAWRAAVRRARHLRAV